MLRSEAGDARSGPLQETLCRVGEPDRKREAFSKEVSRTFTESHSIKTKVTKTSFDDDIRNRWA